MSWARVSLVILLFSGVLIAQHGTAPNGYWPMGYNGDMWSGQITAVNPDTREITLTYKHKEKEETFIGVLKPGYAVKKQDGTAAEVQMQHIPIGVYMVAYYSPKTKKENGLKVKYNEIFDFALSQSPPKN
jgi:hypothetical protein